MGNTEELEEWYDKVFPKRADTTITDNIEFVIDDIEE